MGVLKAKVNGVWEDISGVTTHEVAVMDTDPRQGPYKNCILWFDTAQAVGQRMKVWDGTQWVVAAGGTTGDFLPLTGGTLTGHLTLSGANLGINFNGGAKIYSHTDKALRICEGTNGSQPQIANNDGGGGRDIIDTTNGDARYLTGTTTNISYLNGWTNADRNTNEVGGGGMNFRVNPTVVSCWFNIKNGGGVSGNAGSKVCGFPSGVPAPWQRVTGTAWRFTQSLTESAPVFVESRSDGIYVIGGSYGYVANQSLQGTLTWAR